MPASPPLYSSIDALLVPETLEAVAGIPTSYFVARRAALSAGYSGASIERLTLRTMDGGATRTLILKHLDPQTNWLMHASGDRFCREARLTQSPLWADLPVTIESPVVAVALTPEGEGALLMRDLGEAIYPASRCYEPVDNDIAVCLLDRLGELHAAYWQHPALADADWLATPADVLLTLTPAHLDTLPTTDLDVYGVQAARMWPYLWRFLDEGDAAVIQRTLDAPDALIAAIASAPRTLAHGDLWLANLGWEADRLVVLDWALASAGPATYDSLWLAHTWSALHNGPGLDPEHALSLHRAALLRYGVHAVDDDVLWDLLVDLGWVRTAFMGAEWLVRDLRAAQTNEEAQEALDRLRFWVGRAASIIRARGW